MDPKTTDVRTSFLQLWNARYPETPPIGYLFKERLRSRWARIHSLPQSKRYPEIASEWIEVLARQNAVIDYLVADGTLLTVVINWLPEVGLDLAGVRPEGIGSFADEDGETSFDCLLFVIRWSTGSLDGMLKLIANDEMRAVLVGPDCLIAPYDGGMDVVLRDTAARDAFQARFAHWLSRHPAGL